MNTSFMRSLPFSNAAQQNDDAVVGVDVDLSSSKCDPVVRNIHSSDLSGSSPLRRSEHCYPDGDYGPYDDDGENDEPS